MKGARNAMGKVFYKFILPLLIIMLGSWALDLAALYIKNDVVIVILRALLMFSFGIAIQIKRRYKTWIKKLLVAFVVVYLITYQLGYFAFPLVTQLFALLAIDSLALDMIYVYLGWLFFD